MSMTPLEIAEIARRRIANWNKAYPIKVVLTARLALADMARAAAAEPAGGQDRAAGAELAKPEKRP